MPARSPSSCRRRRTCSTVSPAANKSSIFSVMPLRSATSRLNATFSFSQSAPGTSTLGGEYCAFLPFFGSAAGAAAAGAASGASGKVIFPDAGSKAMRPSDSNARMRLRSSGYLIPSACAALPCSPFESRSACTVASTSNASEIAGAGAPAVGGTAGAGPAAGGGATGTGGATGGVTGAVGRNRSPCACPGSKPGRVEGVRGSSNWVGATGGVTSALASASASASASAGTGAGAGAGVVVAAAGGTVPARGLPGSARSRSA